MNQRYVCAYGSVFAIFYIILRTDEVVATDKPTGNDDQKPVDTSRDEGERGGAKSRSIFWNIDESGTARPHLN